jgi:HEAT repeat protein
MYDASADRSTREEIISLLDQRKEPEAADKLIDIARTSTDPAMRRRAISALSHRKDPRTAKLLSDIVDK